MSSDFKNLYGSFTESNQNFTEVFFLSFLKIGKRIVYEPYWDPADEIGILVK
jgi:hypothetical protein